MNSPIIIIATILVLYLFYIRYYNVEKYDDTNNVHMTNQVQQNDLPDYPDILPGMLYPASPFDDSMWGYPYNGGKTIKSQRAKSIPKYIGPYPYYHSLF